MNKYIWITAAILGGLLLLNMAFGYVDDDFTRRSLESFLRDPLTNVVPIVPGDYSV